MKSKFRNLCVFCGARDGRNGEFLGQARAFGKAMTAEHWHLVYGGGKVGLMGAVADAVLAAGGEVRGVIPDFMKEKEVAHTGLTELFTVDSMHSRKKKMADLADAFVALPGGIGTWEEFFEIATWRQLQLVQKPLVLCNWNGYYDSLLALLKNAEEAELVSDAQAIFSVVRNTEEVFKQIALLQPTEAWLGDRT